MSIAGDGPLYPAHTSGDGRDSQCSGGSGRSSGVAVGASSFGAVATAAAAPHQTTTSPANKATAGAMQRNLPNTAARANSHDNILSVSPFSNSKLTTIVITSNYLYYLLFNLPRSYFFMKCLVGFT